MFLNSPTLASLRFFEAAARLLSFKQAAAELHVTDGAVSQQIRHLEEALRCKLFYRMPRRIALTEEGQRFALVVRRALGDIEQEARAIATARTKSEIRLRVGPSFALRWLLPRLRDFYARHPDIKLFITGEYGYIDPTKREFDLAIDLSYGRYSGLHSQRLMDEYLFPICSPAYWTEHAFLKTPEDLARCTLLHDAHAWVSEDADAEWRYWLQAVGASGVDSQQGLFFSLADMSMQAALTHQGVAMGRASLLGDLLASGQLVMPLPQRVKGPAGYFLVYPNELADRPAMQAVIQWLCGQAADAR